MNPFFFFCTHFQYYQSRNFNYFREKYKNIIFLHKIHAPLDPCLRRGFLPQIWQCYNPPHPENVFYIRTLVNIVAITMYILVQMLNFNLGKIKCLRI